MYQGRSVSQIMTLVVVTILFLTAACGDEDSKPTGPTQQTAPYLFPLSLVLEGKTNMTTGVYRLGTPEGWLVLVKEHTYTWQGSQMMHVQDPNHTWEIAGSTDQRLWRIAAEYWGGSNEIYKTPLPGGWLVIMKPYHYNFSNVRLEFVPDKDHVWK